MMKISARNVLPGTVAEVTNQGERASARSETRRSGKRCREGVARDGGRLITV